MVPSTAEWLDRICSSNVEPARGRPTMKIGSPDGAPADLRAEKKSAVYCRLQRPTYRVFSSARKGCSVLRIALPLA